MLETKRLWDVSATLIDVAMGRRPADLVVKNATLVNVCTGELLPGTDVAVACGRVALVGDASHCVGPETAVENAAGLFLAPGFLDGHIHVESSMMTVGEYARAVVPRGTAGIFMDPHEIANVAGMEGVRAMMEDGARTPLRVFTTTPSCVPAAPGLETTGAAFSAADIAATMGDPAVAGLGEMMDFPAVLRADPEALAKVNAALRAGKAPTGHFPVDDTGAALSAYIASGVNCCHESTTAAQALAKMRLGMYAMLREGTAWDDLPEVARAITEQGADPRYAVLVSDDLHSDTILSRGHMDAIVRLAIRLGIKPVTAYAMASLHCAACFNLEREMGAVAPGRLADFNLLDDIAAVRVRAVFIGGRCVAREGRLLDELPPFEYPAALRGTMRLPDAPPEAFEIAVPAEKETVRARVIGIRPMSTLTEAFERTLSVRDGRLVLPEGGDILKAAVFDRHSGRGGHFVGLVEGFGLREGAVASTYAHDAHNLLVVGRDSAEMSLAARTLIRCGGGLCAVRGGEVLCCVELPVAGLLSPLPAPEVAASLRALGEAWKTLGASDGSLFMTMSLLSLAVIPALRITDKGLVDVMANRLTGLFV